MEEVTAPSSRESKWFRLDPSYLVLALLPWLVLACYSGWIYNSLAGIDHWIYFGYFLNYPRYVAEWFPDRYYGSRLPWVLPGYLLHLFFDPKTARYILHLGFYYIAVFSLYALLRKAVGARTALLTSVLFGTYSFFLGAIGWDYVDGAGLTYNLLALLCMERAANSSRPRLWLAASGAAAAAMFYCNVFLLVFWPMLPAFYIYQVYQGFSKSTLRLAIRFALWFGLGVLLVTLVLGTVNYAVGGGFWFYAPSLAFLRSNVSKPNPWFKPGWHWTLQAGWLALPLITVLGSAFYVILGTLRRTFGGRDPRLFFAVQYLACAAIMIGWHMAGGLGLVGYYYNTYLLPSAFLALGCMLATHFEDWPAAVYWLFLLTVCVAFAVSLKLTELSAAEQIRHLGWFPIAICLGLCLVLNNLLRNRWQMLLLILAGFWICQLGFQLGYPGSEHSAADLARVVESAKMVRDHTGEDPLKFWYNAKEPLGTEFNAVHSVYLWSWSMISRDLPAILPAYPINIGDTGVILSSQDDILQQANRALSGRNLEARVFGTEKIDRDGVNYRLLFFRLEALGAGPEVPLTLSAMGGTPKQFQLSPASDAAAFPIEDWIYCKYPVTDGRMEFQPDGVHVTTHAGQYSYAARYGPIVAVKSGMYRFVLQYEHLEGGLRFGVMSGDESHWIALPSMVARHGAGGTKSAYALLSAGEQVELMVGNNAASPEQSSKFVIKSVRARASFNK